MKYLSDYADWRYYKTNQQWEENQQIPNKKDIEDTITTGIKL